MSSFIPVFTKTGLKMQCSGQHFNSIPTVKCVLLYEYKDNPLVRKKDCRVQRDEVSHATVAYLHQVTGNTLCGEQSKVGSSNAL
jgi:hypothetical protein